MVDGQSSDRSMELVRDLRESQPQIRLLSNPAAIVPRAMNLGIQSARGEIIMLTPTPSTRQTTSKAVCTISKRQVRTTLADPSPLWPPTRALAPGWWPPF